MSTVLKRLTFLYKQISYYNVLFQFIFSIVNGMLVFRVTCSVEVLCCIAAILTAGNPEMCGFMADECLLAIPEIEGIDYTTKELINFVEQLKAAANRLNKEGKKCHMNNLVLIGNRTVLVDILLKSATQLTTPPVIH